MVTRDRTSEILGLCSFSSEIVLRIQSKQDRRLQELANRANPMEQDPRFDELSHLVRELLERVERLEHATGIMERGSHGEDVHAQSATVPTIETPARTASLETRIGSNWLNRIGIVAVLVGIAFFLKYAFESNWVGPALRVGGALVIGIAVMLWSEWFRARGYRLFSYSLKAVSIGVLYLSLWAASQVYALIGSGMAFAAMVAVTAAAILFSLRQRAEVLGALALVGGFVTPVLLGSLNDEAQLFTYVAVLDVAALLLVLLKGWTRILLLSFGGTEILYFAWYAIHYRPAEFERTVIFVTVFFVVFAFAPLFLCRRTSESRFVRMLPAAVAVFNAGAYFSAMYLMLSSRSSDGLFACVLCLGAFFLIVGQLPSAADHKILRYVHSSLGVACITVAIGIHFESVQVTLGWFVEAAALMIIGFWRRSAFVRWLALTTIAVAVIKVFVIDVWTVDRALRIASFTLLGVLLLVISFVYQRTWSKGPA